MRYRKYGGMTANSVLALIAVNLVIFLATLFREDLIVLLGFQPANLAEKPWTIVTNLFVHSGIWHVAANMFTLFFFGRALAALIGERKFLLVYFLGGLAGNLFFMLLGWQYAIVVGASGAVFAAGGALTVMHPRMKVVIFPIPAPVPLWAALIGIFVILSFFSNVAWQAHLGGMVLGLAAGYFFKKRQRVVMF
ncbi:MAG: rhomboid family intramembrane serine protease [Dehalococcoidia bacterium]|nr:rhomboid family intramembrane serine protease [Dehalococcoidia bacterium]